jgi:hypothetical protein
MAEGASLQFGTEPSNEIHHVGRVAQVSRGDRIK